MVLRRRETRFGIQSLEPGKLGAIKIRVVVVAAGFQNNYLKAGFRENRGSGAASCARTNHANIARQFQIMIGNRDVQ